MLVASVCVLDLLPLLDVLLGLSRRLPAAFTLEIALPSPACLRGEPAWRADLDELAAQADVPRHDLPLPEPTGADPQERCAACRAATLAALDDLALARGAHAIATPHCQDDLAEAALRSLVARGELACHGAAQDRAGRPRLVRPLCTTEARVLRHVSRERGWPERGLSCPHHEAAHLPLPAILASLGGNAFKRRQCIIRGATHERRDTLGKPRTFAHEAIVRDDPSG